MDKRRTNIELAAALKELKATYAALESDETLENYDPYTEAAKALFTAMRKVAREGLVLVITHDDGDTDVIERGGWIYAEGESRSHFLTGGSKNRYGGCEMGLVTKVEAK